MKHQDEDQLMDADGNFNANKYNEEHDLENTGKKEKKDKKDKKKKRKKKQ